MPEHTRPDNHADRRSFLAIAAAAAGVVGLGAGAGVLVGSFAPTSDVVAWTKGFDIRLSDIPEGTQRTLKYFGVPVFIRHRTTEEIAAAEAADQLDLPINETIDILGRPIGTADDHIRRATPDGRFIALVGVGSGWRCVPLWDSAGDFNGWFDPCLGAHYDTSGRWRKGPAYENLRLPAYELVDADTLRFTDPKAVPKSVLEGLLFR